MTGTDGPDSTPMQLDLGFDDQTDTDTPDDPRGLADLLVERVAALIDTELSCILGSIADLQAEMVAMRDDVFLRLDRVSEELETFRHAGFSHGGSDAAVEDGDPAQGVKSGPVRPRDPRDVYAIWCSKLSMSDPVVSGADEIVRRYRMTIRPYGGPRKIAAMDAVAQIYASSPELLSGVLDVALALGADKWSLRGSTLRAIATAIRVLEEADVALPTLELRNGLSGITGEELSASVEEDGGRNGAPAIARALLQMTADVVPKIAGVISKINDRFILTHVGPDVGWWE